MADKTNEQMIVPEFYTNAIFANMSAFEMELQCQLIDTQEAVKSVINIRMSPQTAWALQKVLAKQIANYEKNIGPITLPGEIRKNLE